MAWGKSDEEKEQERLEKERQRSAAEAEKAQRAASAQAAQEKAKFDRSPVGKATAALKAGPGSSRLSSRCPRSTA